MVPSPIVAIGASHASVQLAASLRHAGYSGDIVIVIQEAKRYGSGSRRQNDVDPDLEGKMMWIRIQEAK